MAPAWRRTIPKAAKWYRLAADQGFSVAQNDLGVLFQNGLGVPQDYTEAFKLYCLAASGFSPCAIQSGPHVRKRLWRVAAAEELFCGSISDDSDRIDYEMARDYLARSIANPLQAAAELARYLRRCATLGAFAMGAAPHSFAGRRPVAAWKFERRTDF